MKRLVVVAAVAIIALSLSVVPVEAGAGETCWYICGEQYPGLWDPRYVGCTLYCDWYCGQPDNEEDPICLDIDTWNL